MKYTLINTKYRCHCGTGQYLGYQFYPQPFFLLQLAGALKTQGEHVKLVDLFRYSKGPTPQILVNAGDAVVYHIGEYAADSLYLPPALPPLSCAPGNADFSGSSVWLHRDQYKGRIIEPEEVFGCYPDYSLINFDDYPAPQGRRRAVIRLSLGCPNTCIYCPVPVIHKGKYHRFRLDFAQRLITDLVTTYKVKVITLMDDNLFADMELGKQLLKWIAWRGLDVKFCALEGIEVTQADDPEFCQLLKRAGFYDIRVGVETLDPEALRRVKKSYSDPSMAKRALANLQLAGFRPLVFLVDGISQNPKQNGEDIAYFAGRGCDIRNHQLHLYENTPLRRERTLV